MLTLWSIVLIAWLTLHWGILPHIDDWRPEIELRASRAVGLPVQIGRISVKSSGWVPALELRDVSLSDHEGRQVLRLPRISAALSPRTLFTWKLVLAQLYIENPELEVRRDAQGRLHVAGLDMGNSARVDDGAGLDWLLSQPEFVLRHGTLRWVDQMRAAPPLELRDADIVLRNGLRKHELRLDATPPAGFGERFTVTGRFGQPLLARSGDWGRWSGTVYAELPGADLARVRDHLTLPFDLQAGTGAARLWLDVSKGQWRRVTLDAALDDVALRLTPALQPLALQRMLGRLEAERHGGELRLSGQRLAFTTADGASWPASRFQLNLSQRQVMSQPALSTEPVTGGDFSADRLDLAMMASVAERLPLPDTMRRALAELAPSGRVQNLELSWVGPAAQPAHYHLKGRVGGLSIAALPAPESAASGPAHVGRPGWRGADLEIEANEGGGEAKLQVRRGALELPGVFEDPVVPVDNFSSRLVWRVQPQRPAAGASEPPPPLIDLRLLDGQFANADAHGEMQLHWHTGEGSGRGKGGRFPGVIDVTAQIEQGRAVSVPRYMPVGLVHTRDYLAGAIQDGTVRHARLRLRGDLHEFPFAQSGSSRDGEFLVTAKAENLTFAYVPPVLTEGVSRWPEFTQVNGELVFDRGSMRIRDARAKMWGIDLKGVNGEIANLMHEPTLTIEGGGRGPLSDALRFVSATPIDGWLSHALRDATGTGQADLQLALAIPLHDTHATTVKGTLTLNGNDVRVRPDVPMLANAKTRIDFSQRGFSVAPGTARALGGDVNFEGGLGNDGVVRFSAQGTASAEGLRLASELPLVPRLAPSMSGQAPYRLQLGVTKGRTELQITSPLTGMALDLPAPLHKAAESSWPLKIQTQALPAAGDVPRDRLRVEVGTALQADYERLLAPEGTRVQRGAVAVGEAALPTVPATGVAAAVQVQQLNADAWWLRVRGGAPDSRASAAPARTAEAHDSEVSSYLPSDLSLRTTGLTFGNRRWGNLALTLQRRGSADAEVWHATLQGDAAQGQLDYRPAGAGAAWPRWQARLARLAVAAPEGEPNATEAASEAANAAANASTPPAIDLVVDELDWRGKKLGKLEFEGRPVDGQAPRDWRVAKMALASGDSRLSGNGLWSAPRKRMTLELKLDMSDAGEMLERLGFGKQVRSGHGRAQGEFTWTGAALQPDWPTLGGAAQINVDAGQFLKAEPGAARLLGVLSLQALPRRLTLDFRDVFQQGFAFDNLAGDLTLEQGIAKTNNLRIRGVQAAVLIEGQSDLKRETQDLHLVVVPEINAGTASLAYAAINPAIGLGTFLAQLFLRKPLMAAGTREFHVGGTWGEPQISPMERPAERDGERFGANRPGDYPGSDLDTAASAPYPTR